MENPYNWRTPRASIATHGGPAMLRDASKDVRGLFETIGNTGFGYRELGAEERRDAAASRWPLFAATNRELVLRKGDRSRPSKPAHQQRQGRCTTVALVSLSGGSGRTTVAANLAHALSQAGHRTLAVDLDPQNGLGHHFGMEPSERFGLVRPGLSVGDVSDFLARERGAVAWLPFGASNEVELAEAEGRVARDADWLRLRLEAFTPADCEYVILDTPPGRTPWGRQALAVADQVLVVVCPHPAAYAVLPATEALLAEALGPAHHDAVYLLNRFDGRSALDRDGAASLRAALSERVLPFAIQSDEVVREALAHRRTVIHEAVDSQVTADYVQLAEWLGARWARTGLHAVSDQRVAG